MEFVLVTHFVVFSCVLIITIRNVVKTGRVTFVSAQLKDRIDRGDRVAHSSKIKLRGDRVAHSGDKVIIKLRGERAAHSGKIKHHTLT